MKTIYASIDLGGTNIVGAMADATGEVVCSGSISTESHLGPEGVLDRIAQFAADLFTKAGTTPQGVGMAIPGLCDLANGVTQFLPNLPTQWRNVPVRQILEPKIGCPVYLLNDVRMATLGELIYGHGRQRPCTTMAFFALGTGVGGGVVIDGKLRLGPLGAAGELGHITILPDGPRCGCGNQGCLETLASGPAIIAEGLRLLRSGQAPRLHEIIEGDLALLSPKTMTQAIDAGDDAVRFAVERAARYLGIGVANVVVTLHPDLVVLGGGVAGLGEILFSTVRQTVKQCVGMFPIDNIDILPSALGDQAGTLGGIALAVKAGNITN